MLRGLRRTLRPLAQLMLNHTSVINPTQFTDMAANNSGTSFWQRILNDGELASCDALEKLLAGCEIIAAVDDLDLLAA
jgi:hypothetical protein